MLINFLVFSLIFLTVTNWFQLYYFLRLVIEPRIKTSSLKDPWINQTVKKKTGLSLLDITIFHDGRMYGMMVGLPFWPKMILSD